MLHSWLIYLIDQSFVTYRNPTLAQMERNCVVCLERGKQKQMHNFTANATKREQWLDAVCSTPEERAQIKQRVEAGNPPMICSRHFSASDIYYTDSNSTILLPKAVPCNVVSIEQLDSKIYYQNASNITI